MSKKLLTLVTLMASTGIAMAQNAAPAGGSGMGGMMDPAARFKELDKNNDGKLTSEEFAAMQQGMRSNGGQNGPQGAPPAGGQGGPQGGPPAGAGGSGMGAMMNPAERFKQMDKNNDGKVTVEEFTSAMQQMRAGQQGAPAASGQGGK